jgi:hypothetical protein
MMIDHRGHNADDYANNTHQNMIRQLKYYRLEASNQYAVFRLYRLLVHSTDDQISDQLPRANFPDELHMARGTSRQ